MTRKKRERMLAKSVSRTALCMAVSMCFVGVAMADPGGLRITIIGTGGQPVAGATVKISSPDSLVSKTGVTDADGRVRVSGLDPATNYTVEVTATGYNNFSTENVAVVSGKDLSVGYALGGSSDAAVVLVTGTSLAAVDVTSATVGTTLTLDTVESLPTGRSYQSYLQLVPGVKPSSRGNPSSRSGVNYSDVNGDIGQSTDNLYYLDGVDVTDPVTGTFGANFNSEIIQEQQVIVGGVPAEYAGGQGLVSKVVTKSGSNDWHGSVNYYFQNDELVAKDKHSTSGGFSTYDTALTFGGPIIKDRLWFFGSYQKKNRQDDVLEVSTGKVLRSVENDQDYGFGKLTWQITNDDRLTATYFGDPTTISGQNDSAIINRRDYSREQGGDNYKLDYSHTWNDLIVNAYYFKHESQLTDTAVDSTIRDNVTYRTAANATIEQRQLGGRGITFEEHRDREEYGLNFEYFLDTGLGSHTFKGGYIDSENIYFQTDSVPGGVTYASLAPQYAGTSLATYRASGLWTARSITSTDYATFLLPALTANAQARAALDTNNDGAVSAAEADAIVFSSTAGNPYNNVNVYRSVRAADAPYTVSSQGEVFYFQDTWTLGQFTVNGGVRAEKWEHFASDGGKIASFDWEVAPRVSVVYDLFGDSRSKLYGFAGRYYDPIRNDMTDFAGALTGPVNQEQIFVNNQWITFRVRGPGDAAISPSTKTPYTDEIMLGGSTTIGSSIGVSATFTHRETRDIMEDFDLSLYADPTCTKTACGDHGAAYPGSLFYLGLNHFGYTANPGTNFVIGTLEGGKRVYDGIELTVTKYKTDHWFGQMSYTYNDARGNSNSDGNADFQGDWIALDPRAPNIYGPQAGNIEHQFKAYGAYDFDFGLQVSGVFNWNSGSLYTPADVVQTRYLPPMSNGYEFGGVTDTYVLPGFVGSGKNPDYYTFDMRFKYTHTLPFGNAEFFLDIFNVLNEQSATQVVANRAGSGQFAYQEANKWVTPRQFYLGARFSF